MIYSRKRYYFIQLAVLCLAILCIYGFAIFLNRPIFTNADQQLTYHPYYEEWIRLIKDFIHHGELPFYSWYKFLGSDFYSSASIYVTSDLFLPVLLLFESIDQALFFEIILLIMISSFCFSYFLKTFGINKEPVKIIMGLIYSLSGIAVLFYGNYMFLRFYAFLPLLFAGLELYLKHNKFILFILAVFILSFSSIYFMYPTSLFLVLYFYFSYRKNNLDFTFTAFIQSALSLVGYYLIGFSMSLFLNLPAIFHILASSRIGKVEESGLFWDLKTLVGFLVNHGTGPFALFTDIPYIFYSGTNGHGYWYSLYASSLVIALNATYFLKINDRLKKYFLQILTILILIILFKPLNSVFHAFSQPTFRYSFLLVFMNLLLAAHVLDTSKLASIKFGYLIYSLLMYSAMFLGYLMGFIVLEKHLYHILFIVASNIFGWMVILSYDFKINFMYVLVIVEMIFSASVVTWTLNADYYTYEPSLTKEYIDYFNKVDESKMFRWYIDPKHLLPSSSMNLNQSLHYNFLSVMSYDSAYEPALTKFLQLNNINWHIININSPELLRMLGVKYFAVYNENELPSDLAFKYVFDLDFLKVYQLENYRSIGFTYSNFQNIEKISSQDSIHWNDIAYLYPDDLEKIKSIPINESVDFTVDWTTNNSLVGHIDLQKPSLLFLSIPMNKGWKFLDNGNQVDSVNVNGGFTGIILDSGYHKIEMYFMPCGFKLGLGIALTSLIIFITLIVFRKSRLNSNNGELQYRNSER